MRGGTSEDPAPSGDGRWDELAADLVGEAAALAAAERDVEADEIARAELSALALSERLRATVGRDVVVQVQGAESVRGRIVDTGPTWFTVADSTQQTVLLLVAVLSIDGLGTDSVVRGGRAAAQVWQRRGLGQVLRAHVRGRVRVRLVLRSGDELTGTLDMVGADHVELAVHPREEPRRRGAVLTRRVVPFTALAFVQTAR